MAKSANPGIPDRRKACSDLWHSTLSIRQETCPSCEGTGKKDENTLGSVIATEAAFEIVEAIRDATDGSEDDD